MHIPHRAVGPGIGRMSAPAWVERRGGASPGPGPWLTQRLDSYPNLNNLDMHARASTQTDTRVCTHCTVGRCVEGI